MEKVSLKIDWATHEAAKYACEKWHYSKCMPAGKLVKLGAWENEKFIGVILFGLGATPHLSKQYGLKMTECCELTRVALTSHKTPVSRMIAIAMKLLKQKCPGLKLVVSFADSAFGHHGGRRKQRRRCARLPAWRGRFNSDPGASKTQGHCAKKG